MNIAPRPPIAIIGMGCRMPQADGVEAFWQLLRDGVDAIGTVPTSRWDVDALWSADAAPGKTYCRFGGFVADGDCFDAGVFDIDTREAQLMDPQQGMVLECAWHALEHAGISPNSLRGSNTGVFMGISNSDFDRRLCANLDNLELLAGTGTSYSIVANRLSYALGLCGPSIALDLACASSLIAVHLACQSLLLGESDLALAGGVHLILSPEKTVTFSRGKVLARDGRCKSFAANADGYVRGEGCGVVALKRLADALRDGDPIVAVIRGSATNHNGASNGLSAPLGHAQERVMRAAYAAADIDPATIGLVEAHSPGTVLGDLIETRAIAKLLVPGRSTPCFIGSVKSNIGHLEGAAGIASLIKAALAVSATDIPPTLHAEPLNRNLPLATGVLEVATKSMRWGTQERRAGVSAFSFGGANAHVVIEAPPENQSKSCMAQSGTAQPAEQTLLVLSARSQPALRALAHRYREYLQRGPAEADACFADVAYSAATGRAHMAHRLAVIAASSAAACETLERFESHTDFYCGIAPLRPRPLELHMDAPVVLDELGLPRVTHHWVTGLCTLFGNELQSHVEGATLQTAVNALTLATLLRAIHLQPAAIRVGDWATDVLIERLGDINLTRRACESLRIDCKSWQPCKVLRGADEAGTSLVFAAHRQTLWQCVAAAYVHGHLAAWPLLLGSGRRLASLPQYPFERQCYWKSIASEQPAPRLLGGGHA